jgi:23S rRNA (guanosine2251-2'-O)-methyltransferase
MCAIVKRDIVTAMKNHMVVLIIHNIRSAHNVGSLLRSADGFGIEKVYLTGFSPYPKKINDERLPHLADKIERRIQKTALGAVKSVDWEQNGDITGVIKQLKSNGYEIAALEQSSKSIDLISYKVPNKIALIVGNEVEGLDDQTLNLADVHLEIPMQGRKESFNVAVAGAIAMYYLKFLDKQST